MVKWGSDDLAPRPYNLRAWRCSSHQHVSCDPPPAMAYDVMMDITDARATLRILLTSSELAENKWALLETIRDNLAKTHKELARATVIALGLIALFELLRLGVVDESARVGPIRLKQTIEVQLFVPPLVAYFVFVAAAYRSLGNALREVHRLGVSAGFPLLAQSNVGELLLPVSVDIQGFPNKLGSSRSALIDDKLGLWAPISAFFGSIAFVGIAYVQIFVDGVNPVLGVVSLVVAVYFLSRAILVFAASDDTRTSLTCISPVTQPSQ
ncbi:MAG TPA: hypothetical protein VF228_15695 [Iamia sp.]